MSQRVIKAKYRSKCYECGQPIEVGDEIIWDCDDRDCVWHKDCHRTSQEYVSELDRFLDEIE